MKSTEDICGKTYSQEIKNQILLNHTVILNINITNPQIQHFFNQDIQKRINIYYRRIAESFNIEANTSMKKDAVESFRYRTMNNYPIIPFEAYMTYDVMLHTHCYLSILIDQYRYMGGAHGSTTRSSATWDLKTGQMLRLSDLFLKNTPYTTILEDAMITQASDYIESNPSMYFENYQELIRKNFNPLDFYVLPDHLVIYYQQYEIGPYASGILEFKIPYTELKGAVPPY